jgi:hypothetical protein
MSQKKTRAFPKKVFIYVCDYDDNDEPICCVSTTVDDIPEDSDGEQIGSYSLEETSTFRINRHLQKK